MRSTITSALFVLALASLSLVPAQAQPLDEVPADCRAAFKMLSSVLSRTNDTSVETIDNGCRATNFQIRQGMGAFDVVVYDVAEASIVVPDLFTALTAPEIFSTAQIEVKGIFPHFVDKPLYNYVNRLTMEGLDIRLDLSNDVTAGVSTLNEFTVDAGSVGSVTVSARLSNLSDGVEFDPFDVLGTEARLDHLDVRLDDSGFFRLYIFHIFGPAFPFGEDPRPHVEAWQRSAIAVLSGLPLSEATKASVTSFINGFPDPSGQWHLQIAAPDLPLADLADFSPGAIAPLFDSIDLEFAGPEAP